ncbi:MAG: hypothetical protein LBI18_09950 [Planctomycetaceae bacterium]|jgi:hypothetical protein|nr:hypothetical protein [Planctomycetaceae bacterium]
MGNLQEYLKGFEFQIYGQIGDVLRFTDSSSNETKFYVQILARGKTYNFDAGSEQELIRYEKLKGQICRVLGKLARRKNMVFGVARISVVAVTGDSNWKDPTEEEFLAGLQFGGWCILSSKRSGSYAGNVFQKVQVAAFGETFEFVNVSDEVYNMIPENVMFQVRGRGEPRISSSGVDGVRGSDLVLILDGVRADPSPSASPSAPPSGRERSAKAG